MKKITFSEATPLIKFINKNKSNLVGHVLKTLYSEHYPSCDRRTLLDYPLIFEVGDFFAAIIYKIPSYMEITICSKKEAEEDEEYAWVMNSRKEIINYFSDKYGTKEARNMIEGCIIEDIIVERFSEAFEINGSTGEMRPEGGDYFSTIRLVLSSGAKLCFCGADAITDGYNIVWVEK